MLNKIKSISISSCLAWVCTILTATALAFCFSRCLAVTKVQGNSMNPTLSDGDIYIAAAGSRPRAGDIVIADSTVLDTAIVKRVVGVPGDTLAITDGTVYRNGVPLEETYLGEPMDTANIPAFTLEEDMYFLMGDNRNNSLDSRRIGPVSREEIRYVLSPDSQPAMALLWLVGVCLLAYVACVLSDWESAWIYRLFSKRSAAPAAHTESEVLP